MTLGYTKMGSLENYEYFFGAPVSPEKIKDYTEHHALTYHFPDAYAGSNTKIRDTLNNLILKVVLRRGVLAVSVAAPLLAVSTFVRCALRSRRSRGKPRSGSPSSSSRERCARCAPRIAARHVVASPARRSFVLVVAGRRVGRDQLRRSPLAARAGARS